MIAEPLAKEAPSAPRQRWSETHSPSASPRSGAARRFGAAGQGLLTLAALALVAGLSIAPLFPRSVAPAGAPPGVFSAERAMPHLRAIAARPHPVGSAENAQVRDYLLGQIRALGLEPQVQRTAVLNAREAHGAVVENVLVRLPGTANSRAVLFVAHYDAVVGAPGAGDNGMSVAAMVETLRALRAGPPLGNDLVFLFDDGEEAGKLGSFAFIQQHPWAGDVGLVFDFDADGPTGPTTLLWTTPGDGWLVGEMARSGTGLLASSAENPGKRAEFGNDLHVFAAAGYRGAHFDRVGGSTYYHSPRDSLAFVDPAALQRQGDAMLALARHFGNLTIGDGNETRAADTVFFTLFGLPILSYPVGWSLPLALLAALALAAAVGLGLRRHDVVPRQLAIAVLALVGGALAAAVAGHLAWQSILAAHPESRYFSESDFYGQEFYVGGLYVLVVALGLVALPWLIGRLSPDNVAASGLIPLVVVALVLSAVEPQASYLALWPALFGALGLLCLAAMPARNAGPWAWARIVVPLLAAVPSIGLLGAALFQSTIDGVGASPAMFFGILVLLLGALAPQVDQIARLARRALPAGIALAGAGLLVAGGLTSGYSAAQPRPDILGYVLNADTGRAYWVSPDPHLDEWTGQFLAGGVPRTMDELLGDGGPDTLLARSAPVAPLPPPTLDLLAMERTGDVLTLRLRLRSPRGARNVYLSPMAGAHLLAVGLDGAPPAPIPDGGLQISGLPTGGLDVALRVRATGTVSLGVTELSTGLPEIPGANLRPRPETVMSAPFPEPLRGYPTVVHTSFVFGANE